MATVYLSDYLADADYYLVPVDNYERGVTGAIAGPCRLGGALIVENWSGMVKIVAVLDGERVHESRGHRYGMAVNARDVVRPLPPKPTLCEKIRGWFGNVWYHD
jgi:hypothetical protein